LNPWDSIISVAVWLSRLDRFLGKYTLPIFY
jgi:hypothetical protein